MRRSKPVRIGELWAGFIEENPARKRCMAEARIPELWPEVVGPAMAAVTSSIEIRNGVLYVRIASSVARHELFMRRESIRSELNGRLGMNIIGTVIVK